MRRAFAGRHVYHLAAVISVVGPLGGLVESTNVFGTRMVAEAARLAGVGRLVHCSSVHAFDTETSHHRPRSTRPAHARPGPRLPAYDRSKAAGEDELRRVIDRGLDATIVNPTGVIGPADEAPSRMGAVLRALWRRRMMAVVAGGFDWVDVATWWPPCGPPPTGAGPGRATWSRAIAAACGSSPTWPRSARAWRSPAAPLRCGRPGCAHRSPPPSPVAHATRSCRPGRRWPRSHPSP